jgi:dienelactone hydrolase
MPSFRFPCTLLFWLALTAAMQAAIEPRVVSLTATDGTVLKATYFAAAKPGPGVLLLHQCNMQRKAWDGLADRITAQGIHVLTLDYRGYGDSGGARFADQPPEEVHRLVDKVWPGDFDVAFQYLQSQTGVMRDVMGAGGASCGVNNSIQLARRHPEVKALVLLSGETNREGRLFLQSSTNLPVFTAAADDDQFGDLTETMRWLYSVSANTVSRFQRYATGKHGAEMFAPHPELMDFIALWLAGALMNKPGSLPKTNGVAFDRSVMSDLDLIDKSGGAGEAEKKLAEARKDNPQAVLFSEAMVNLLGYEHMRSGDTKGAVEIMKFNVMSYPDSPNAYDSLAYAYVADGQKELARQNAKKTLQLLANDTKDNEERKKGIRESAEGKLK